MTSLLHSLRYFKGTFYRMSPVTVTFRTESATGTRLPRPSFMGLVFWVLFFRQEKLFEKSFGKIWSETMKVLIFAPAFRKKGEALRSLKECEREE